MASRRRLRLGLTVVLGSSLLVAGVGAWGARSINRPRTRFFSDRFVLTPESLRIPYKKIDIVTADYIPLEGWWMEQSVQGRPSDRVVLLNAPYNHDKSTLLAVARALWESGHSVLLYDFRAFSPKPPGNESIGHKELLDGQAALAWLRAAKPQTAKIGIMGCSMGGAVTLMLAEDAGERHETDLVGVVTDCAFHNLHDVVGNYIRLRLPALLHFAVLPLLALINTANMAIYGYDLAAVGPGRRLEHLRVPMLLLHSEKDQIVPLSHAERIRAGAVNAPDKQLKVVPGVDHLGAFFQDQQKYSRIIINYLDEQFAAAEKVAEEKRRQEESQRLELSKKEEATPEEEELGEEPKDL